MIVYEYDHPFSLHVQGGKILVHGIEGLNRSAAVVVAFLMTASYCVLEDAYFYLKVLKPHLQVIILDTWYCVFWKVLHVFWIWQIDEESMECLFHWEKALFGKDVSRMHGYTEKFWIEDNPPHHPISHIDGQKRDKKVKMAFAADRTKCCIPSA